MDPHLGAGCRISAWPARIDKFSNPDSLLLACEAGLGTKFGATGTGDRAMGEKHFTEAALAGLLIERRDCLEVTERRGGKAVT